MQSHLHCAGYRLASSKPHHAAVLGVLHADRVKMLLIFHVIFHWYAWGSPCGVPGLQLYIQLTV